MFQQIFVLVLLLLSVFSVNAGDHIQQQDTERNTQIYKQLGLLEIVATRAVEGAEVPVISRNGRYLVHIQQIHASPMEMSFEEIQRTIGVQKAISRIISRRMAQTKPVLVCPEGTWGVSQAVESWHDTMRSMFRLRTDVRSLVHEEKDTRIVDLLSHWREWHAKRFSAGYAQTMHLVGASIVQHVGVRDPALSKQIGIINPFGSDALLHLGAVETLYYQGVVKREHLVACENRRAFEAAIPILTGKSRLTTSAQGQLLARFAAEREATIVKRVAQELESNHEARLDMVFVVLGVAHDLGDHVHQYNRKYRADLGLIEITPQGLTEAVLKLAK